MVEPKDNPTTLHGDQEHRGIRFSVLLTLVAAFILSYVAVNAVLRSQFPGLSSEIVLSCLGALPLSLLAAGIVESLLKRVWHSGRRIVVDGGEITLEDPAEPAQTIDRSGRVNQLWWYFPMAGYPRGGRERRVPKKWYCFAGQIQQEGASVLAFCFAPPKRKDLLIRDFLFRELDPADVYDTSLGARVRAPTRPVIPPEIIASADGPYWLAERDRWKKGIELTPDDFFVLLQAVRTDETP